MIIPKPELRLISTGDHPLFQLAKDYVITLDDGLPIIQPKGFITDLASIPCFMWSIPGFSPEGDLAYGSIPHDFGYQYGYLLTYIKAAPTFPEASMALYEQHKDAFGIYMPVFVGRKQYFFDELLSGITREATGEKFVPWVADKALWLFGDQAWDNYRIHGPAAYNTNSLGLPGLLYSGRTAL